MSASEDLPEDLPGVRELESLIGRSIDEDIRFNCFQELSLMDTQDIIEDRDFSGPGAAALSKACGLTDGDVDNIKKTLKQMLEQRANVVSNLRGESNSTTQSSPLASVLQNKPCRNLGEGCGPGNGCCDGLECHGGNLELKCYHKPRQYNEPCHWSLSRPQGNCANGLSCHPFIERC